jgi:hypothetical protein
VALMNEAKLPAIYPEPEYADDGGLMAYGANVPANFRRAADSVPYPRGHQAGDLPIQQPVKFDSLSTRTPPRTQPDDPTINS